MCTAADLLTLTNQQGMELTAADGELIDQVLDIHRTVLASKDDIRELDRYWPADETRDGREIWWNYLTLDYTSPTAARSGASMTCPPWRRT